MPVPTVITDLSTTAGSNSPAGSESIGTNADDYIRAHAAFIAALRDGSKNLALGSAGAPSQAFTSDSNTGFYSPGADQVGIAAGGVTAVVVTSTALNVAGLIFGRSGAGNGLGRITVSTSSASSMVAGDVWLQY